MTRPYIVAEGGWSTCRYCGEAGNNVTVKYGTRHYAHPACYFKRHGAEPFERMTARELGQLPVFVMREAGLDVEPLYRAAIEREGGEAPAGAAADSDDVVTVYGVNARGGHNVSVVVQDFHVLITSDGPEQDEGAEELARQIVNAEADMKQAALDHARTMGERDGALRGAAVAREALAAAVEGRRRFFGPVLLVPARDGDWTGAVWLLDPEKCDRGHGLRFESLAQVRALHPELWIVSATEHGVLLDAAKLPTAEVPA